ncbi:MAG TPA: hypothetical protein VI488_15875 [Candidatus Angelobacter sp.]
MDEFVPQTGGLEVREGHEESDISVRGIVIAAILLVALGVGALIGARVMITLMTKWEDAREPQLTPAQQQLRDQRQGLTTTSGKTSPPAAAQGIKAPPDWYGRGEMEEHLGRTFPVPRLQYDDVYDLDIFRKSENEWLEGAGRDADGSIHIPIDQAMDLLSQRGLPAVSGPFLPANAPANILAPESPSSVSPQPRARRGTPERGSH